MLEPGASRLRKGAELEKQVISSGVEAISTRSKHSSHFSPDRAQVEPTLIADEIQAGDLNESRERSLPDETIVGIPTDLRLSIAALAARLALSQVD